MKTVCLITPSHLAANPRLVKEADALSEAGYGVEVFACQYMDWATDADESILRRVRWPVHLVRWGADSRPLLFWKSRLRQHACRRLLEVLRRDGLSPADEALALRAYDRVLPELVDAVLDCVSDVYIAHNLAALPVAAVAARTHAGQLGFDAEDFHSGMRQTGGSRSVTSSITEYFERRYLPECAYVTASSPGIAEAYARKYGIPAPVPVLNVFPLSQRPRTRRPTAAGGPLTLYWFSQTIGVNRGLEDVVRALGLLRGRCITLHLRGNWQPGYRQRLYDLAASVGVEAGQIVFHSPAPPDELVRIASEFDVGLALEPGRDENNAIAISNKLFVYLLAGNALIATGTEGQRVVLNTIQDAGFCYRPGDVDALAQRLKLWLEDRESLEEARRAAWDWGARRYNWDREKERFLRVVEETVEVSSGLPT